MVAVDEWCPVTNPFTHMQHGHLRVLLAMGLEEQVITRSQMLDFGAWIFQELVHKLVNQCTLYCVGQGIVCGASGYKVPLTSVQRIR